MHENINKAKKGKVIMNLKRCSFLGSKANIRLLILTLTVMMSLSLIMGCDKDKKAAAPPPPPEVKVAKVLQKTTPVYKEFVGQTRGQTEVEIRARVEGFLETVNFKEGSFVKKGQLLYTIDKKPLEAKLDQAKGNLAQVNAALSKAQQDVARFKPLMQQNAIPKQDYDTAVSQQLAAEANVQSAKASVDQAQINLGYTSIYSPMDGIIGKTEVNPGNLVGSGQKTLLTTVSTIDPIHVRTSISESEYLLFSKNRKPEKDAPKQSDIEMILADGSVHKYKGGIAFAESTVDAQTGTLMIELAFPNPEKLIRSGQYAKVRAMVATKENAILVPQRAVQELQGTFTVAVVDKDNKVELRPVTAGERVGNLWIIEKGLNPEERIIVEGLQKVKPGVIVKAQEINIEEEPAAAAAKPDETAPQNAKKGE